jgi:hypothetical protein
VNPLRETRGPRITPTNAGPDSKGMVSVFGWDLEGMVAFYLVGGALAGMLVVFILSSSALWTRLGCGLVPLLLSALWVKLFIHGRPPAYQADLWEARVRGPDFRLRPHAWCRKVHPRAWARRRQEVLHG